MSSHHILPNFINGAFSEPAPADVRENRNPANRNEVVATVSRGSAFDASSAVIAASSAASRWRALTASVRGGHLQALAAIIEQRSSEIASVMVAEVGKPRAEALGEVARGVAILRYFAAAASLPNGSVIPAQVSGSLQFSVEEPLGVVALITPWNFPLAIPLWKAAPALAFGNTVVLKASEYAGRTAVVLAECVLSAGLPAGVFNVIHGDGESAGEALIKHDGIAAISFTGSRRVGAHVATVAAARNIRSQTEMGGKNAAIVLRDAELPRAARLIAGGGMRFAGQKCTATSRVVVEKQVYDEFLSELESAVSALILGPPDSLECAVGPVIHAEAQHRVLQALRGVPASDISGGTVPSEDSFSSGCYITPAIVRLSDNRSAVAREELFGPVIAVFQGADLADAIAQANDSQYGLSASLFTRDVGAALEYITRIEAGMVRVNGDTTGVDPYAPFGGMKGSSSGSREQGQAARAFYTMTKTVQINP